MKYRLETYPVYDIVLRKLTAINNKVIYKKFIKVIQKIDLILSQLHKIDKTFIKSYRLALYKMFKHQIYNDVKFSSLGDIFNKRTKLSLEREMKDELHGYMQWKIDMIVKDILNGS